MALLPVESKKQSAGWIITNRLSFLYPKRRAFDTIRDKIDDVEWSAGYTEELSKSLSIL